MSRAQGTARQDETHKPTDDNSEPAPRADAAPPVALAPTPPAAAPLSPAEIRAIFVGLMLAVFLGASNQTIVATALPTMGRDFHDFENLSWVVTAYLLTSTAITPLYGKLSDIHGRRAMMLAGIWPFHRGISGLRDGAQHDDAHSRPRAAGPRRRRHLPSRRRPSSPTWSRRASAAATRAIWARCSPVLDRRPGARRRAVRASALVADLLDQRAARTDRAGHDQQVLKRLPRQRPQAHGSISPGAFLMMAASISLLLALTWGGTRFAGCRRPILVAVRRLGRALARCSPGA